MLIKPHILAFRLELRCTRPSRVPLAPLRTKLVVAESNSQHSKMAANKYEQRMRRSEQPCVTKAYTHRDTQRQTDRQADRQAGRQRETDRERERERERQREKDGDTAICRYGDTEVETWRKRDTEIQTSSS